MRKLLLFIRLHKTPVRVNGRPWENRGEPVRLTTVIEHVAIHHATIGRAIGCRSIPVCPTEDCDAQHVNIVDLVSEPSQ